MLRSCNQLFVHLDFDFFKQGVPNAIDWRKVNVKKIICQKNTQIQSVLGATGLTIVVSPVNGFPGLVVASGMNMSGGCPLAFVSLIYRS